MTARLCDDAGRVSNERVDPPNLLDAELTYLKQLRNLQSRTPNATRYTGEPFACTGSAHLAGEHIQCTSPAHTAQGTGG